MNKLHVLTAILMVSGLCVSSSLSAQTSPPIASFSASPFSVCTGEPVQFYDLSQNNPTSWYWTFIGGTPGTSTQKNPLVYYATPGNYNVILLATNSLGSDVLGVTKAVSVVVCTGLNRYTENVDASIFPNPAGSFVTILTRSNSTFRLLNLLGSELLAGKVEKEDEYKLSLNNLSAGVYFVEIRDAKGTKSFKLVKE